MGELHDLLERTTPTPSPLDINGLAAKGAARHRRRRTAARGSGVVTAVGALAAGLLWLPGLEGPVDLEVAQTPPDGSDTAETPAPAPTGWQTPPAPPLTQTNRVGLYGATSDGRFVIWGPHHRELHGDLVGEATHLEGAVLDPDTQVWTVIPEPPAIISPEGIAGAGAALSGRWLTVWDGDDGGATYNLDTGRWTTIPPLGTVEGTRDLTQVGDTFLIEGIEGLQLWSPETGWRSSAPYVDGAHGSDTGFIGGLTVDHNRRRIALMPTPTVHPGAPDNPVQGAIYDLPTDSWTPLPAAPLADGEYLSGGGFWTGDTLVTSARRANEPGHRWLTFDTSTGTWSTDGPEPLPTAMDGNTVQTYAFPDAVVAQEYDGTGDPFRAWQLTDDQQWEAIALPHDATGRAFLVAADQTYYLHEILQDGTWRNRTSSRSAVTGAP